MRYWTATERLVERCLCALMAAMTIMCLAQIVWRYALHDPLVWTNEAIRFIFVWIAYASAWLAWKHRAHIAVDAVLYLRNPKIERFSALVVEVIILLFCAYTFYVNFKLLGLTIGQPSPVLGIPMSFLYAAYTMMSGLIVGDILVSWFVRRRVASDPVVEGKAL